MAEKAQVTETTAEMKFSFGKINFILYFNNLI